MNCLILGGDKRYYEIINNFVSKGYNVDLVGYKTDLEKTNIVDISSININEYDIVLFPMNGVKKDFLISAEQPFNISNSILNNVKDSCVIFSGIMTPCLEQIKNNSHREINIFMKDEKVINENVIPTVEGMIADLVKNTDITINDSNIIVIGYGHIGKYLVKILNYLGADVTTSIIEENDKKVLDGLGIKNIFSNNKDEMKKNLKKADIVVNTVPNLVLNREYIDCLQNDSYVLDVSSYPHGVDKEYLDFKKINNHIYLGIPSDIASKTSGKILVKKIDSIIGG